MVSYRIFFLAGDTKNNIPSELAAFTTYKIIDKKCPILKREKTCISCSHDEYIPSLVCNIFFDIFGFI